MRRAQPGHATALLVDEDRSIPADRGAQFRNERPGLRGIGHVAFEQDEAVGIGIGKETPLVGSQRRAGAAEYDRARIPAGKGRRGQRLSA